MNTLDRILKLRSIILFIGKVIAILFCAYYIINANDYKISWSLFDYLMPTYISKINNILSSIGTYILIIPLVIILGSILIPENTKLHIMSSLFGIMSIVITTIKNIATKNTTEITNFRLFKVSHILSLDEKREIFVTECNRIITEKYLGVIKIYNYLMSKLNNDMISHYDKVLENLNLPSQIKQYSQALIIEFVDEFQKQSSNHFQIPGKWMIIGVCAVIAIFVGAAIANELTTDWAPTIKGLILGHQGANVGSLNLTDRVIALENLVKAISSNLKDMAERYILLNRTVDTQQQIINDLLKSG